MTDPIRTYQDALSRQRKQQEFIAARNKAYQDAGVSVLTGRNRNMGGDEVKRKAAIDAQLAKDFGVPAATRWFQPLFNAPTPEELTRLKGESDRYNLQLQGANQRIFNEANAANRNAALRDQAAALEAPPEQGTSDTATQANNQSFETATPGGTSGRRRRNPVEVGSIRI